MNRTLTEQQLEELRPLAAVIEGAITDTPIRLGTDDWGTMLASALLVRVAAYMGGVLPPVMEAGDWLTRGTRDLSIPEQTPAAAEDVQRADRRAGLRNLLSRAAAGLTPDEDALLRQHVEAEMREADQWRAGRHTMKQRGEEIEQDRDRIARHRDHLEELLRTETARANAAIDRETTAEEAQAAIERVRAIAEEYPAGIDTALIHAALDLAEPTTEQP